MVSVVDDLIVISAIEPGQIIVTQDTFSIVVNRAEPILTGRLTWELTYHVQGQPMMTLMSLPLSAIEPTPGDITGDGMVNFEDFVILSGQWHHAPGLPSADIAPPPDYYVDLNDLLYLAEHWLAGTMD